MVQEIKNVVTWLKNWFYDKTEVYAKTETYKKSEVDTALNSKLNSNLTTANKMLVTDGSGDVILENKPVIPDVSGKIDTAGTGLSKSGTTLNHSNSITAQTSAVFKKFTYDGQGHITGTSNVSGSDLPTHNQSSQSINESNTLRNLGFRDRTTQDQINVAIDGIIGQLQSIKAIEVVSTLPTASASTLGKLYILSENSKINVYYTEQDGTSYSWHKMDADILDELSIDWSEIENKPSTFTPSSHASSATTYGVGTTANYGHNKVINDLTHNSFTNGESLSAYQGYVLNQAIESKQDKGDCVTSITLVPKGSDPTADAYNGVIRLYYGDEPSS